MNLGKSQLDLSSKTAILALADRTAPYWRILQYCRHLGIEKTTGKHIYWVARIRKRNGGYSQTRLGIAVDDNDLVIRYDDAVEMARQWFESPPIAAIASAPFPLGVSRVLSYDKKVTGFTVGDALRDYIEWKRIAATRSHFEVNLSLVNYHIIPRLGDLIANEVNNRILTEFCLDVLQTPPKLGNQPVGQKIGIETLSPEALRKRKKTLNTLIGILRLALRMAWENGEIESERSWRCIRRLPNQDAPRHVFLNRPQCRSLLEQCRPDLRKLVRGALYSGCRVSELTRMWVGDVGAGVFGVYIRPSKNGRARYVVLSSEGMAFFLTLAKDRGKDELLFSMQSGRTWNSNHKHLFKAAARAAGLPEAFVFHGLRHTYASQLVQVGTPLAVVATQLGHSNTDTVSRTYGHLSSESIEAHLERGFAPIDTTESVDQEVLQELRRNLSLGQQPTLPSTSWPRSNFSLSSFAGSLLRGN